MVIYVGRSEKVVEECQDIQMIEASTETLIITDTMSNLPPLLSLLREESSDSV